MITGPLSELIVARPALARDGLKACDYIEGFDQMSGAFNKRCFTNT